MIKAEIKRNLQNHIISVSINGHADFADPGEDIVCAAVSGIVFGISNSVEKLLSVTLEVETGGKGVFHCSVPQMEEGETREKTQLLMEAMISSLQDISGQYEEYLQVHDM